MIRYLALALAEEGAAVTVVTSRIGEAKLSPAHERLAAGSRLARGRAARHQSPTVRRHLDVHAPAAELVAKSSARPGLRLDAQARRIRCRGCRAELGFPVVLRPEGAGATGDVAWQAWGRFGRSIAERCRQADQFVAISPAIRDELVAAAYPRARIVDLPNGVPVPAQAWQRRHAWKQQPVAVSVGRLAPEKGHADLLAAWPAVLGQFPSARLVLVGDGPERPHLEELRVRHRLHDSVTLAGTCSDVLPTLRSADLFVLPSREEGMSLAPARGDGPGNAPGGHGDPGQSQARGRLQARAALPGTTIPSSLARTIVEQWNDMDRAIHLGRAARSLVQQRYTIAAVARQHLDLFDGSLPRSDLERCRPRLSQPGACGSASGSSLDCGTAAPAVRTGDSRGRLSYAVPPKRPHRPFRQRADGSECGGRIRGPGDGRRTMLKILQVIPTLDRSGAEKQMALLARGLPRDRFAVEVAALTRLGPLEGELRAAGVPVTLIGKRLKLDLLALQRLGSFMKARRFDVVNTWIFAANTYGRIAAHLSKVPVVVTSEMAVDLWKNAAHLRVDRWLARWSDRVVGNSQAVVDFYRRNGIPAEKLVRIYSGVGDEPVAGVDSGTNAAPARDLSRRTRTPLRRPPGAPERVEGVDRCPRHIAARPAGYGDADRR